MEKYLYEIIEKRKSVRKYKETETDENIMREIMEFLPKIEPLYPEIKTEIKVFKDSESKGGLFAIKAPQYFGIFSESRAGNLENAGYMLQQLDLFLSLKGIGSCWLGMAKPKVEIIKENALDFIIAMAFGHPDENLWRQSKREFKRRGFTEISDTKDILDSPTILEILEAARLAPSATNSQPWYFEVKGNNIIVYKSKLNTLKAFVYGKMNQIDMGIAMCHLKLASENQQKNIEFVRESTDSNLMINGYEYFITGKLTDIEQ